MTFNEMEWCKKYVPQMFKLLRSETPEDAWMNLRLLHELEEEADKHGKTILQDARLIDR
jgi:hypothetical protein